MVVKNKEGKEVYISTEGQYHDDIQICEAYYVDNGAPLTDDEIHEIVSTHCKAIYEDWFEKRASMAEAYFEGDR